MNKLEQAARQALEALIKANHFHDYEDEITALREALAEQAEQEPVAWMWACAECGTEAEDGTDCRICGSCGYHKFYKAPKVATCVCAAKTQEQAEQEPVSQKPVVKIHQYNEFQTLGSLNLPIGTVLYAAPVRTKDLTDDELREIHHLDQFGLFCDYDDFEQIARAVIQKYKEKNNV